MITKLSIIARLTLACCVTVMLFMHTVRQVHAGGISLRPPFDGSYAVTAWFDHYGPDYTKNGILTVYTGETSGDCNPAGGIYGYCYDGHSGTDYALPSGTPVLAAADGRVIIATDHGGSDYGKQVLIGHNSGFSTLYGHLSYYIVNPQQVVTAGTVIGYSGSTGNSSGPHLHFGVYRGTQIVDNAQYVTDLYGWQGSTVDPLQQTYGAPTATCQWRSLDSDPISCADTIVEDGQVGSAISGGWNLTTLGNSYLLHYRYNDNVSSAYAYATWAPSKVHGVCKIYAWIPAYYATTEHLTYWVSGYLSGWHANVTINQNTYSNQWVYLRTDQFIGLDYPIVSILGTNTGEPINTKWIAADAMKFRCYKTYIPFELNN